MGFGEWEKRIDNRISEEIQQEFYAAAECCDAEKMNSLHEEWNLFYNNEDDECIIVFAKVKDGVMDIPEQMLKFINEDVRYKWILKDTGSLYLVENNPDVKYVEDAVRTSAGNSIDERLMYIKDAVIFDDTMQKVFNWHDEDISVIYVSRHWFRVDKF